MGEYVKKKKWWCIENDDQNDCGFSGCGEMNFIFLSRCLSFISKCFVLIFVLVLGKNSNRATIAIMGEKEKLENSEMYIKKKAEEKPLKFHYPK